MLEKTSGEGERGGDLRDRHEIAREARVGADPYTDGHGDERADGDGGEDAREGEEQVDDDDAPFGGLHGPEEREQAVGAVGDDGERGQDEQATPGKAPALGCRGKRRARGGELCRGRGAGEEAAEDFANACEEGGAADEAQDGGAVLELGLGVLHLELVGPDDERAPDELVDGHDHEDHRDDGVELRPVVVLLLGHAHVGTEAGHAIVFVAEVERLDDREEEPAAGDGDHAVINEALGGEGKLDVDEALPGGGSGRDGRRT